MSTRFERAGARAAKGSLGPGAQLGFRGAIRDDRLSVERVWRMARIAMDWETTAAEHYRQDALVEAILAALAAAEQDSNGLSPTDLAAVDEFHLGGRAATAALASALDLGLGQKVLDIGSGLGGASRYFAGECGCEVAGIDLTDAYVRAAQELANRTGLADRVSYRTGSALDLPFERAQFDGAYMLHVGMNIPDKARLFAEVRRVLKAGAKFAVYDVMRIGDGEIDYPMPWASDAGASFVESASDYRRLLAQAGFVVDSEHDKRDMALAFLRQARDRAAESSGPPRLGLHLVMGPSAPRMMRNMLASIESRAFSPVALVCRAV